MAFAFVKIISLKGETSAGTDYQVKLKVGQSSGSSGADFHLDDDSDNFPAAKGDGGDFSFTDMADAALDFWIEGVSGADPDAVATCWVEVSTDLGSDQKIKLYYGDVGAANLSDGATTFPFFDDFTAGALNGAIWDTSDAPAVDGSDNAILDNDDSILGKTAYGVGYEIRARAKADEQDIIFVAWANTHWLTADNVIAVINSDFTHPNDFDRMGLNYEKAASATTEYFDGWTDFRNTYYQYWIKRFSTTSLLSGQELDSDAFIDTNYIPTVDLKPNFQAWDSSQESTLTIDWVFVKKVIATEPSFLSAVDVKAVAAALAQCTNSGGMIGGQIV